MKHHKAARWTYFLLVVLGLLLVPSTLIAQEQNDFSNSESSFGSVSTGNTDVGPLGTQDSLFGQPGLSDQQSGLSGDTSFDGFSSDQNLSGIDPFPSDQLETDQQAGISAGTAGTDTSLGTGTGTITRPDVNTGLNGSAVGNSAVGSGAGVGTGAGSSPGTAGSAGTGTGSGTTGFGSGAGSNLGTGSVGGSSSGS